MKTLLFLFFTCASAIAFAQVNFVKNPSFEDTVKCPGEINQISYALYWTCAVDTVGEPYYAPEYFTASCIAPNTRVSIPQSIFFYQYPHTGNAMVGASLYYDKTLPVPAGATSKWRDYFQGRFHKTLEAGRIYCVSFWITFADNEAHAHDKIGAFVDDGGINSRDTPGIEILDITPQVYTTIIQKDTQNWTRIEGTFIAVGNETHITLGNFFPNSDVVVLKNVYGRAGQYSYYLFDDVSVIPIDLKAEAGKDSHAEPGKPVQIGRVGDTTALGLDCRWYHKGALIDSGAIISVNGAAIVGTVDTYVVVQTICGLSKNDTVTVTTVPLGMKEWNEHNSFSVYPNPSGGTFTISTSLFNGTVQAKVYDLLGRVVFQQSLSFTDNQTILNVNISVGIYILELSDTEGNIQRERVTIK